MNGLLTQKPGRDPEVGQIKNYQVIHMPALGGKNPWTKIKNPNQDNPGEPFKITSVKPTGFTDSYGNISFNIDIEPTDEAPTTPSQLPHGGGMSKDDYWTRKEKRDIEGVARMGRAHAQEMSLRFFNMMGGIPGATTPKEITDKLKAMIDFFEKDVRKSTDDGNPYSGYGEDL